MTQRLYSTCPRWVRLYRGVDDEEMRRVEATGLLSPAPHNAGNAASVDRDVAVIYATERDDEGWLLGFLAPADAVEEDPVFRGDYRFLRAFKPRGLVARRVTRADRAR